MSPINANPDPHRLFTVAEVADPFQVRTRKVYDLLARGGLA